MRSHLLGMAACVAIVLTGSYQATCAEKPGSTPANPKAQVASALDGLDRWLGTTPDGRRWRDYLTMENLRIELPKGPAADRKVVAKTLEQLSSGAPGLEKPQFAKLATALKAWLAQLPEGSAEPVSKQVLAAKATMPELPKDNSPRQALDARLKALDQYLAKGGKNGAAWRQYLRLDDLQTQLKSEKPDPKVLAELNKLFVADNVGLELPVFMSANQALQKYRDRLEAQTADNLKTLYDSRLDSLAKALDDYSKQPSETGAIEVGQQLSWLERLGLGGSFVAAARQSYSRPNVYARVSRDVAAAGVQRDIDDMIHINDNILGANMSAEGHTVGKVDAVLIPSSQHALMETVMHGVAHTKGVSTKRSAIIRSEGDTTLEGHKQVMITPEGFTSLPATATAETHTQITGIGSSRGGMLGNMVTKMATKQAYQKKSEAEQIGSEHAAARLRERLNAEASTQLAKSNDDFQKKFRNPLMRVGQFPQLLSMSSSCDEIFIVGKQADGRQLGAPSEPPAVKSGMDMSVQVHESMFNNFAAALLSGVTWQSEQVKAKVIELRGSLPDRFKEDDDRDPWSITFADERPISVKLDNGGYTITVRGSHYTSGERNYKAMNVTAIYKVERTERGAKMIRQGELQIFPPDFVEGKTRFSIQQQALRTILQKKFSKIFAPESVSDGLELPGNWEKIGKMPLAQLVCDDGWLTLGWVTLAHADAEKMADAGQPDSRR